MSIPYDTEIINNDRFKLKLNFSNIKNDIADESIVLSIYAYDGDASPIFTEKLSIEHIRKIHRHLDAISVIKDGISKSSKFIETTEEISLLISQFKDNDLDIIKTLLQKFESNDKIKGLLKSLNDLEIKNLYGAYHHKIISDELDILKKLLDLEETGNIVQEILNYNNLIKYKAKQPEKIFQNWIEHNLWIFGVDYIQKHDVRKIALNCEGDLLMETVDGYLDLIELKRPKYDLLNFDKSHNCYYPHPNLSQVIGQCLFYTQKLFENKHILQDGYKVKVLLPRIKIIAGRSKDFDELKRDCVRMLNGSLSTIQLITYDDLLMYGNLILKSNENSNTSISK